MKTLDALFKADSTALSLRQKRLEILGSNIANAATPHFKARDIDFEAAYKSAMNSGDLTKTSAAHIDVGGSADTGRSSLSGPTCPRRSTAIRSSFMSNKFNSLKRHALRSDAEFPQWPHQYDAQSVER